jgi:hypothetical protein
VRGEFNRIGLLTFYIEDESDDDAKFRRLCTLLEQQFRSPMVPKHLDTVADNDFFHTVTLV